LTKINNPSLVLYFLSTNMFHLFCHSYPESAKRKVCRTRKDILQVWHTFLKNRKSLFRTANEPSPLTSSLPPQNKGTTSQRPAHLHSRCRCCDGCGCGSASSSRHTRRYTKHTGQGCRHGHNNLEHKAPHVFLFRCCFAHFANG